MGKMVSDCAFEYLMKYGIDISPETIHNCYQEIKDVSDQKSKKTLEKRAQALLITKNNIIKELANIRFCLQLRA